MISHSWTWPLKISFLRVSLKSLELLTRLRVRCFGPSLARCICSSILQYDLCVFPFPYYSTFVCLSVVRSLDCCVFLPPAGPPDSKFVLSSFWYRPCSRVLCKRRACPAIFTSSPGSWSGRNNWKCACRVWDIRLSLDCSYPLHICIRVSRLTLKLPLSKTILLNIVISILHEAYQVDSTCVCLCGCTHMHMHNVMLFTTHAPVYKVEISSAKTNEFVQAVLAQEASKPIITTWMRCKYTYCCFVCA